ncbi:MAG TPA: chemotaxis-specific protein-glutamate methyltransferase CheB [Chthoniobacteraceae bacterium]|jgi:chemotaxis response regulator CheB|nr:chemotaxis-specific protein-glutamate methyltransferase CheB [Chthoniobacteraceae bacterium]
MKIAIINDKPAVAEVIRRAMLATGRYQVVWTAGADADAVALCQGDRPDLLLIDLASRDSHCIRRIMQVAPCAILVSTETIESSSAKVFDAMGAGALDVVQTPVLEFANGAAATFLNKIDSVACLVGRAVPKPITVHNAQCAKQLVAIGSSAGGPAALAQLLRDLPADLPAAVIIVQHIDAQFAPGLAKWLSEHSKLPVKPAASGDMPANGTVFLAATNDHLVLESASRLGYTRNPVEYSYRPSVNAFFESAARHWRGPLVGVLLTGMGSDGAKGLKMLRNLGHYTIAQDQKTSAVYGMPKAAAELQAAAEVLPLECIAAAIGQRCRPHKNP